MRQTFIYATRSNVPDLVRRGGNTYKVITDHLGSPRMIVNSATGDVAQQITYDAFGKVTDDTSPGFTPFGFAGGLYDNDTGLTHFGARDYDAGMGRWTAADPISFAGGDPNLYGYVLGDPVNLADPSGLLVKEILGPIQFVPKLLDATLGVCLGSGVTVSGAHAGGKVCVVRTGSGESGVVYDTGAGIGFPAGAEANVGLLLSNVRCLKDFDGPSDGLGGSAGIGPYSVGGDVDYSKNASGRGIWSVVPSWAPGARPFAEGNAKTSEGRAISFGSEDCECQ